MDCLVFNSPNVLFLFEIISIKIILLMLSRSE